MLTEPDSSLQSPSSFFTSTGKLYSAKPGRPSPLLGLTQAERDTIAAEIEVKGTVQPPCCGQCALQKLSDPSHVCKKYDLPGIVQSRHGKTKLKCGFCVKNDLVCVLGESAEEGKEEARSGWGRKRWRWEEFGVAPQKTPKRKPAQAHTHTVAVLSHKDREGLAREIGEQGQIQVQETCCGQCRVKMMADPTHLCVVLVAPGYGKKRYGKGKPKCQFCMRNGYVCVLGESAEECKGKMPGRQGDKRRGPKPQDPHRQPQPETLIQPAPQQPLPQQPVMERLNDGNYDLYQPTGFDTSNQHIDSWRLPGGTIPHDLQVVQYWDDDAQAVVRREGHPHQGDPRSNANEEREGNWHMFMYSRDPPTH